MKTLKILTLSLFLSLCPTPASGFDATTHGEIIKEALTGTLSQDNIKTVMAGASLQEQDETDNAGEPQRHFNIDNMKRCCDYVQHEQARIISFAGEADKDSSMCYKALFHFGMLLHTVQNFYSNTNYLSLITNNGELSSDDPYGATSALVDWSNLFADLKSEHPQIKISVLTDKTKRTTDIEFARGMALRESIRQWNYIEKLITSKYGKSSTDIVSALKNGAAQKPSDLSD